MTLGQRVAQKRKELGLSQEGLGEKLGVSRQAIYKWESDASTPEVDKLIALSKIFSVSVGWLLGLEEDPEGLTQDQERLMEDILSRYQAAQPAPRRSAWDKWPVRILFALCGVMLALLVGTSIKVKEMEQSIYNVQNSVNYQISSITSQLRAALEDQDDTVLDWSAQLASTDLAANTATFDFRVIPKTYTEGMGVRLIARSGDDTVDAPARLDPDLAFTGQLTCPLTDDISLSIVFTDGGRQTPKGPVTYQGLYTESFPPFPSGTNWFGPDYVGAGGAIPAYSVGLELDDTSPSPGASDMLRVGLFQDRELLVPYEYKTRTRQSYLRFEEQTGWWLPRDVTLEPGHEYHQVAVYIDAYGRQFVLSDEGIAWDEEGSWQRCAPVDAPEEWRF